MGWEIIIVSKRSGLHGWEEEGNSELSNGNCLERELESAIRSTQNINIFNIIIRMGEVFWT